MQFSPYETIQLNQPVLYNLILIDYSDVYRLLMYNAKETVYGHNNDVNTVFERILLDYFNHKHGPTVRSADPHGLSSITLLPKGELIDLISIYDVIAKITRLWMPGYRPHVLLDQMGIIDAAVHGHRYLTLAIRRDVYRQFITKRSVFE